MHRLRELIKADPYRIEVLKSVATLNLPECYVAAGFVRNLVWDFLHGYERTELNDIDVVYYDKSDIADVHSKEIEHNLYLQLDGVKWEVKNQALMHNRNNDRRYESTADAMSFWPEKETAIGVKLVDMDGSIDVVAPFGIKSLYDGLITHNPKRSVDIFKLRIENKQWLRKWPLLKVVT